MDTCRAAVITEHNKPLTIQKVPIPKLDPGSLLVKITASTLCGRQPGSGETSATYRR